MMIRCMKLAAGGNRAYATRMDLQLAIEIACDAERVSSWCSALGFIYFYKNLIALH